MVKREAREFVIVFFLLVKLNCTLLDLIEVLYL